LRILLSAFSAYSPYGSESLVGHTYARVLGRKHRLSVITCAPTDVTTEMAGIDSVHTIDLGGRDFNEVGRAALLSFELKQFRPASRALRRRVDLIHRVNPCSIHDPTFLAYRHRPLVIGPILASGRAPESFREIIWREILHTKSSGSLRGRLQPMYRLGRLVFDPMERRGTHLRKAVRILVGSEATMAEIPPELHGRCEPIVYAGVEHDTFVPPRPEESTRGAGPARLLAVGRLKPHKGLELLLRACGAMPRGADFTLTIIGQGRPWYTSFLKELAVTMGISDRVEWIPSVKRSDLIAVYRHHDLFCFPSVSDTYGVALLEAMSSGLPALVSMTGGPAEIVSDECGVRIPVQSPEQYVADASAALADLIGDAAKRARMGEAARRRILDRHDWGKIGARLEAIYEALP